VIAELSEDASLKTGAMDKHVKAEIIYVPLCKHTFMNGVRYITDEAGHKTAVVIELEKLREIKTKDAFFEELEDTLDIILREDEPSADWDKIKDDLLNKD
jgi:hypothetical protein